MHQLAQSPVIPPAHDEWMIIDDCSDRNPSKVASWIDVIMLMCINVNGTARLG